MRRACCLLLLVFLLYGSCQEAQQAPQQSPSEAQPQQKQQQQHVHHHRRYELNERLDIDCKDMDGKWGPPPVCLETGEPLSFHYGQDAMIVCTINNPDPRFNTFIRSVVNYEKTWQCRARPFPEAEIAVPFFLPFWGVAEDTHIHLGTHAFFVCHGEQGILMGISAYPVQQGFQVMNPGGPLAINGPVQWFEHHSFKPLGTEMQAADQTVRTVTLVLLSCTMTALVATGVALAMYFYILKPRLERHLAKMD
eukprot:TRINITY_DN11527_c0_g1_i1.p1 TRINITY_DN11527_c0_g1~~TRINITY_DN11527_c0_g1_i1.p1  ORF type:complete len:251 (+),score=34.86 TRINITY_DN11527_c0_g1_i1:21-773(+)